MKTSVIKQIRSAESVISMFLGVFVVIVVGILLFNYFKSVATKQKQTSEAENVESSASKETPAEEKKEEARPSGPLPQKYTTEKGDSLWKISLKFFGSGFNWVDISRENKLCNPNFLLAGQELTLPNVSSKKDAIAQPITGNSYQVVKGDNLWGISVRAYQDGFKWQEIAQVNHLASPNLIHPGNILTIPR